MQRGALCLPERHTNPQETLRVLLIGSCFHCFLEGEGDLPIRGTEGQANTRQSCRNLGTIGGIEERCGPEGINSNMWRNDVIVEN